MAKIKDLSFSESESFYWLFILHDAAGNPLDLNGALVEWAVASAEDNGPTLLATSANGLITITSAMDGEGYVLVPSASHSTIVNGEYTHELRATLATNVVTTQISGRMSIGNSPFTTVPSDLVRSTGAQLVYDSSTADANPGDGEFRLNHLTPSSATYAYINVEDRFGVSIAAWLAALDDSTTASARGYLRFTRIGQESTWYEYRITGDVVTGIDYRKIPIAYMAGADTLTAGDYFAVTFSRTGDRGIAAGLLWNFDSSTTTGVDPGDGDLRLNNATLASVTTITLADECGESGNPDASAWIATWDDSSSAVKGYLTILKVSAPQNFAIYSVSAISDGTTHYNVTVAHVASSGSFSSGDVLTVSFSRTGDAGSTTGTAPEGADYLVKTAHASLTAERVVTDSPTIVADWSTAGVVKFNIVGGGSATTPIDFKDSVACATTANITLSGEQTIDGVLTSASRVLVKDQSTGADNGIYVSAAGAWSRATDADTSAEVTPGMLVLVEGGTVNGDQVFILTTNGTITLGTTALAFQAIAIPTNVFVGKTVSGTTYTTVLTDSGKRLNATNAGTKTVTIAKQSTVNHAVNTEIEICNIGAGLLTVAPDTGVTLNSLSSILTVPQYHSVKAKKRANPNTWEITGVHYRIGTDIQAYDADTLKSDTAANLTAGFTATAYDAGTKSSGTYTPDPDNGNFQRAVNGGAHTLAPPSATPGDSLSMIIQYTNNASAGTITTSGFTKVNGDALTTTNGDDFMFYITVCNGFSHLAVTALQ